MFVVRTSKPVENLWKNGLFWSRYCFVTHSIDRKPRDWGLASSAYGFFTWHFVPRSPFGHPSGDVPCASEDRSALVNIRRKALLSSVGFRKRMTSRSTRGIYFPVTHVYFCFDRPLWFVWWPDVCFEVLSCFLDHPSIDSTKKMPLHLFGKDVLMFRLDQAS